MKDYVVAINTKTKEAVNCWAGDRYRNLNEQEFHQFRISMALSETDAKQRALDIYYDLQALRAVAK